MITNNDITIIGTSELRSKGAQVFRSLKTRRTIISQKGKPIGILQDYDEYMQQEAMIEQLENLILGSVAKQRLKKKGKYISSEKMQQLIFG